MFVRRMFVKHLFVVKHLLDIPASNVTPQEKSGAMTAVLAYPPNPPSVRPLATAPPRVGPARAQGAPVAQPAEVYWRRRLLVLAVVLSLLVGLWSFGRSAGRSAQSATSAVKRSPDAIVVVVQPGDTLWAIASWLDPSSDPRSLVEALGEIAGSDTLHPGQRLIIPSHLLE